MEPTGDGTLPFEQLKEEYPIRGVYYLDRDQGLFSTEMP